MCRKKVTVSIVLTEEISEKLTVLARRSGRSRSAYIRQVLRRYIQYVETKDTPNAKKVDWDIDRFRFILPPGESTEQKDK